MAAVVEVKYFNTFLLKKTVSAANNPIWDGSRGIPQAIGGYKREGVVSDDYNWTIEESRIRGGYNNTNVDYGVKAYLVEDEPNGSLRINSLIYSGIFNSRTGINNTNVFSVGEEITKSADPANGSIQKLYAEDSNLIIFQESKISRALIDKDAIYSAEGGGAITNSNLVIGTIQPYAGEFGISTDPGSFAVYGYKKYFTDKYNNVVLRLDQSGIFPISQYGMLDYFRDELEGIDPQFGVSGKIIGGWDIHNKQYLLSTQAGGSEAYKTLSFDEQVLGWPSFYSFKPEQIFSVRNNLYTVKDAKVYEHYAESNISGQQLSVNRGTFYGEFTATSIQFVFNPQASSSKNFKTIAYEGDNGWQVDSFISDGTGQDFYVSGTTGSWQLPAFDTALGIYSLTQGAYDNYGNSYPATLIGNINYAGFARKENKYVANLVNNTAAYQQEVIHGQQISGIKGYFATVTISTDSVTNKGAAKELFAVSSNYTFNSGY